MDRDSHYSDRKTDPQQDQSPDLLHAGTAEPTSHMRPFRATRCREEKSNGRDVHHGRQCNPSRRCSLTPFSRTMLGRSISTAAFICFMTRRTRDNAERFTIEPRRPWRPSVLSCGFRVLRSTWSCCSWRDVAVFPCRRWESCGAAGRPVVWGSVGAQRRSWMSLRSVDCDARLPQAPHVACAGRESGSGRTLVDDGLVRVA